MLLCNNSSSSSSSSINSMEVPILASKTMTTKKEERVVVVEAVEITIRLFNNNSNNSRVVRLLNWEVKLSDFKDNSNKLEEPIQLPQVVDGRTKLVAVVAGAEVQPNPVAGKVKQRNDIMNNSFFWTQL
jgi:hypothetical protein